MVPCFSNKTRGLRIGGVLATISYVLGTMLSAFNTFSFNFHNSPKGVDYK